MRSLFIALLVGIILLAACSGGGKKILSEKKMTELLTEVHVLDGYLSTLPLDSSRKIVDTLYTQLFAKYGLDSISFTENVERYYADPEKTEKIYDKIQEDLTAREKEMMRVDSVRSALQRDSMDRVNRYQNLLSIQQNLLRVYHTSEAELNIAEYNTQLYRASGLGHFWQKGTQRIPSREATARPPDPYAHIPTLLREYEDELTIDSLPGFERYNKAFYKAIGLPRLWPDIPSVKEEKGESASSNADEVDREELEGENESGSEENETAS